MKAAVDFGKKSGRSNWELRPPAGGDDIWGEFSWSCLSCLARWRAALRSWATRTGKSSSEWGDSFLRRMICLRSFSSSSEHDSTSTISYYEMREKVFRMKG